MASRYLSREALSTGKATVIAGGVVTVGIIALTAAFGPRGYVGKAGQELQPLRAEFEAVCRSRTTSTLRDGSLDEILQKRDEFLTQQAFELGCEQWYCWGNDEILVENIGTYEPQFAKKKTCAY